MVRNSFGDENSAPMVQEDEEEPEDPVERERVVRVPVDFFAAVLRDREAAGFFAAVVRERVAAVFFAVVLREREAAGFLAAVLFAAVDRVAGRRAAAVLVALLSSAATRARSPATSFFRSSRTFRSPIASRKRLAA